MTPIETLDNPQRRPVMALSDAGLRWLLEEAAAAAFRVPPDALRARSRGAAATAFARQSAMYLAHVVMGLNYSAVGRLFERDRTTAAYACRLVEDRRDDLDIDVRLKVLEELCCETLFGTPAPPVRQ